MLVPGDLGHRPLRHDLAAGVARPRPEIDQPIGGTDGGLVVLDDDHRVAQVAHAFQRADQALVVARVQADRRLIEHV